VTTTLDRDLQRLAVRAVSRAKLGEAQAALVAMRPDGRVVAMIGGKSYKESPFNRATQARRQPGSAFKLFVYLAALRAGWTPDSKIEDRPITIDGWSPANNDGIYRGTVTLREAFARSSNAAAVRLAEQVGRQNVIRTARELGISTPLPNHPSAALGTAGVSLLELTAAYAAVASGRYPVGARGIESDEEEGQGLAALFRSGGGTLDRNRDQTPMLDLLWAAANEGTGKRAALQVPTFGKTGTTQEHRDALFVGFAGNLVVGVWVGRDDDRPLKGITGGTLPASIWRDFLNSAIAVEGARGPDLPFKPRQKAPDRPFAPAPVDDPIEDLVRSLEEVFGA
jgi:penicillin-binding protein 1A